MCMHPSQDAFSDVAVVHFIFKWEDKTTKYLEKKIIICFTLLSVDGYSVVELSVEKFLLSFHSHCHICWSLPVHVVTWTCLPSSDSPRHKLVAWCLMVLSCK